MTNNSREGREGRAALGCYLLTWGCTVIPLFVLTMAWTGGPLQTLEGLLRGVVELQPLSLGMLLLTAPMVCLPYLGWRCLRKRV